MKSALGTLLLLACLLMLAVLVPLWAFSYSISNPWDYHFTNWSRSRGYHHLIFEPGRVVIFNQIIDRPSKQLVWIVDPTDKTQDPFPTAHIDWKFPGFHYRCAYYHGTDHAVWSCYLSLLYPIALVGGVTMLLIWQRLRARRLQRSRDMSSEANVN